MRLDKRIVQAVNYNVKEIVINKENYNKLSDETKSLLKLNDVKITFNSEQKDFICKFNN